MNDYAISILITTSEMITITFMKEIWAEIQYNSVAYSIHRPRSQRESDIRINRKEKELPFQNLKDAMKSE